jgi:hypothetical protein
MPDDWEFPGIIPSQLKQEVPTKTPKTNFPIAYILILQIYY